MLVLPLCQKNCPDKLIHHLSTKLGDGAHGEVFELTNNPTQVIKFSILVNYWNDNILKIFSNIERSLNYLILEHPCIYAKVFSFEKLYEGTRIQFDGSSQEFILYSYVMEKCFPLSEDEKKVFHSIFSHEDLGIKKNYPEATIKKMLSGMSRGLDFDAERVIFFYRNFKKSPIQHLDNHIRNLMKDNQGNFKLIDFDRTTMEI